MTERELGPYATAGDVMAALDAGQVSSEELTRAHIERIERLDGQINAVVVRDFERALEAARAADQARRSGARGALLGLPMTVKDAFYVDGLPASGGGIPERADVISDWDAPLVARLKAAGAIILGKTNMPPYAADHQTNNPLYGRTNNPWDLTRTPGGSSGGAAAALASGMTPLEIGGDYAGSIRVPSAFCGLFGHKTSETIAPRPGHFPGGRLPNTAFGMAVQGPLARSAADLRTVFDVMIGPQIGEDVAWRVDPPPARANRLSDLRVAVLPRLEWLPLDDEIAGTMDAWASRLSKAGARVAEVDPLDGDLGALFKTFLRILFAQTSVEVTHEEAEQTAAGLREAGNEFLDAVADGWLSSAGDFLRWYWEREIARERLRRFFQEWDVLLAPCACLNAFEHTEWEDSGDEGRSLPVNGEQVNTVYLFFYPALCNVTGHPGTAFPAGRTRDGLPIGLQAIGPYLEDRTGLRFAALVEREFGGFSPPPGYRE